MRIAVVHDWLYTLGGAEKVLQSILQCFPSADVYCLFDLLDKSGRQAIGYEASTTSFLQHMPMIARYHRMYLPLMPLAIEQLDLRRYDLVISSSYAVAKGVITGPDQLHVSYVHSPMRYAWDLQHQYLEEAGLKSGLKSGLVRLILHSMRLWDVRTAHGVDHYIVNSHFVARRVLKLYGRRSEVIYPPVRVPAAAPTTAKEAFFLTASRLVPYKNVRPIIEAFARMPEHRLIVVGDGPDYAKLRALAGPNVTLLGFVDDATLQDLMTRSRALVFAAEEDFGIIPVEAQAFGTPVIALGRGGARETVITEGPGRTGTFFDEPTPDAIVSAVREFAESPGDISALACHANASRFTAERFRRDFSMSVNTAFDNFKASCSLDHRLSVVPEPVLSAAAE